MKKSQRLHFTIQAGRSESYKDRVFLGFFCSFLLFFFRRLRNARTRINTGFFLLQNKTTPH